MGEEYVKGVCNFVIVHRVTTNTSGTERMGPSVHWGDFPSELAASLALANAPEKFTRTDYGWRGNNGYTKAHVARTVLYDYPSEISLKELPQ